MRKKTNDIGSVYKGDTRLVIIIEVGVLNISRFFTLPDS